MRARRVADQAGQVLVMVAVSMVVLVGAVGLAIDSGLGYMVKAKLNAAVDSASVAAARAVVKGDDQAAQSASAKQAARDFFDANYPAGYLGSTPVFNDPVISFDRGMVTIDTSAQATLPVGFMRVLGFTSLDVVAAAQTQRKDLDLAFVMDTSNSLIPSASQVRSAAALFIDKFSPTTDRMALIHFSHGAEVDEPIRPVARGFDRTKMINHVGKFDFTGYTNSSEGMWNARDQLNRIAAGNRSTLRVIVFFSDGVPTSFASRFDFRNPGQCATAGTIIASEEAGSPVDGLYRLDRQSEELPGACFEYQVSTALAATGLPRFYNAHGAGQEFPVETTQPRAVSRAPSWTNVSRASRNLAESVAEKARREGIYVFTLGLGPELTMPYGPDAEIGQELLKCMANTADSLPRCYKPAQPVGVYCFAANETELKPCFSKLASEILRITR
ncbi:MAG: hypothetical protein JWQ23_134 [Herminiimonas sp.]|nr:hypothetical protein [Herminiimonas sp.]